MSDNFLGPQTWHIRKACNSTYSTCTYSKKSKFYSNFLTFSSFSSLTKDHFHLLHHHPHHHHHHPWKKIMAKLLNKQEGHYSCTLIIQCMKVFAHDIESELEIIARNYRPLSANSQFGEQNNKIVLHLKGFFFQGTEQPLFCPPHWKLLKWGYCSTYNEVNPESVTFYSVLNYSVRVRLTKKLIINIIYM